MATELMKGMEYSSRDCGKAGTLYSGENYEKKGLIKDGKRTEC